MHIHQMFLDRWPRSAHYIAHVTRHAFRICLIIVRAWPMRFTFGTWPPHLAAFLQRLSKTWFRHIWMRIGIQTAKPTENRMHHKLSQHVYGHNLHFRMQTRYVLPQIRIFKAAVWITLSPSARCAWPLHTKAIDHSAHSTNYILHLRFTVLLSAIQFLRIACCILFSPDPLVYAWLRYSDALTQCICFQMFSHVSMCFRVFAHVFRCVRKFFHKCSMLPYVFGCCCMFFNASVCVSICCYVLFVIVSTSTRTWNWMLDRPKNPTRNRWFRIFARNPEGSLATRIFTPVAPSL